MSYETAPVFPMSQQVYTLVEMPCIVRDANKAIEMLGGISVIEKVANNEHKFLELRFRGPMSHATYAAKNLVLMGVKHLTLYDNKDVTFLPLKISKFLLHQKYHPEYIGNLPCPENG